MFTSECLNIDQNDGLTIGGVSVAGLARKHGTPLYIMDEDNIRLTCRRFKQTLAAYPGGSKVCFASKALSTTHIYRIMKEEGIYTDVVSGGELFTALNAGFDPANMYLHGSGKSRDELVFALEQGVGRIVIDNREELELLGQICEQLDKTCKVLFRVKPGVEAHTHEFIQTGKLDSKFGTAVQDGQALEFAKKIMENPRLELVGIHCHIGSQIFETKPFELAAAAMVGLFNDIKTKLGHTMSEINMGGGFGARYLESERVLPIEQSVGSLAAAVAKEIAALGLDYPDLVIEPGRSLVCESGITVYTVSGVKEIPGIKNYLLVDGGMSDNPRFALYDAEYTILDVNKPTAPQTKLYTMAGKHCESDTMAKNFTLPEMKAGDLVAVLSTGAYVYSMSSNYNKTPRPPMVFVSGGKDKVAVRRETYADLVSKDV